MQIIPKVASKIGRTEDSNGKKAEMLTHLKSPDRDMVESLGGVRSRMDGR